MNISLSISKSIEMQESSLTNKSNIDIKKNINNNNYEFKNKNNNIIYKHKLVKNSISMPNLLFQTNEKKIKSNIKNNQFYKYLNPRKIIPLKQLEKKVYNSFINNYIDKNYYNIQKIDEIVNNEKSHLVAEFKEFLVIGDVAEFLHKFYNLEEIQEFYPQILEYYNENLFIFPNYVILPESKYIYLNIQKKQKIIDIQEENEENEENENNNDENELKPIFTNKEIESLLNQTDTSGIKQYFGLSENNTENSNGIDKNEKKILKLIDNIIDYEKNENKKFNTIYMNKDKKKIKKNEINNISNNTNKIFYKIKRHKIKNKNNRKTNSRNTKSSTILISEIHKNESKITCKRNNLSQPNLINQNNVINGIMINSINNRNNNYKETPKRNNKDSIIKQNNKNKLKDKFNQKNIDNKIIKKLNNTNNWISNEQILNNINNNTERTKLNKIKKINKKILNEINNYQNNKNKNIISSIKSKNYKKLLMNVLLSSRIGTINDSDKRQSNFSKKIINKNIYNSEADSVDLLVLKIYSNF